MEIVATRIRKGMLLKLDGELYRVHDYQHITPGKGNALMQTKLKSLKTGSIIDYRFRPGDKVEKASLETRPFEFLYRDGNHFVFMDRETYEQVTLDEELVGEAAQLLKENQEITLYFHEGQPIGINLPKTVELQVTECEPAFKGATVASNNKPLTLETGLVVKGPEFINVGDVIKVDTEDYSYVERAAGT